MESRSYNLNTMCVCESICILEPVSAFNLGFEQAHTRPPKAPFLEFLSRASTQIDRGCAPRSLSSKAAPSLAAAWAVKVPLPVYSQAEVVGGPAGAARERQFTDPAPSPPATTSSTPPHDYHYHYYYYGIKYYPPELILELSSSSIILIIMIRRAQRCPPIVHQACGHTACLVRAPGAAYPGETRAASTCAVVEGAFAVAAAADSSAACPTAQPAASCACVRACRAHRCRKSGGRELRRWLPGW